MWSDNYSKIKNLFGQYFAIACWVIIIVSPTFLHSQTLDFSRNRDFSTADLSFSFSDTLFARVIFPQVDFTDIDENSWSISSKIGDKRSTTIEGKFINHYNGTFTFEIALEKLERGFSLWRIRVKIEDDRKHKFDTKADITVAENAGIQGDIAVTGIITSFSEKAVIIGDKAAFEFDDATVIKEFGEILSLDELELEQKVEIAGEKREQGLFYAREIVIAGRPDDEQSLTINTTLDAVEDSTIFVSGTRYCILPSTIIQDMDETIISLADFKPGMEVKISTISTATDFKYVKGLRIADEEFRDRDIEVEGFLNKIISDGELPDTIQVASTLYEIPPNRKNQIHGFDGKKIDFSELRLGEYIKLEAVTRADQIALMTRIDRFNDSTAFLIASGSLSSVSESKINLDAITFELTERTIILNTNPVPEFLTHEELAPGQLVQVLFGETSKGVFETRKIFILNENVENVTIAGEIESVFDNGFTIGNNNFTVTEMTAVLDRQLIPISFLQLQAGDLVEVTALPDGENTFIANNIRITGLRADQIAVQSFVDFIEEDVIVAGGVEILIDATTVFLDENNDETGRESITDSSIVEVVANEVEDEVYVAETIQLVGEVDDALFLEGKIDAIAEDTISVLGERILVTPMAVLRDESGDSIAFNDFNEQFHVNTPVRVQAIAVNEGPGFAWLVEKTTASIRDVRTSGPILSIDSTGIIIINNSVINFEPSVFVIDSEGGQTNPGVLRVNEVIEVFGVGLQGFAFADTIWILNRSIVTGVFNGFEKDQFNIARLTYEWTPDILVLDQRGLPVPPDSLLSGSRVEAAVDLRAGKTVVRRIRILTASTATSIFGRDHGRETKIPDSFQLSQNYPNPIALAGLHQSGTTIHFTLTKIAPVTLKIFNILGQEINTLYFEKQLTAGDYNVIWQGRDARGLVVAPGIYFYRLETAAQVQTRKIVVFAK